MTASSSLTNAMPTSAPSAVAMAPSRYPSPLPRCLSHTGTLIPCPPSGLALQRFTHFHRDSASLRYPAVQLCSTVLLAQVPLCPCFTLLLHVCLPPLSIADLAVADSPLFARRHQAPAGRSPTIKVCGITVCLRPLHSEVD